MAQSGKPVCVGVHQVELVASTQVVVLVCRGKAIVTVQYRGLDDHICTCLVQCNRVCRSQNAEVGHDGGIVVVPAVAFGDTFMMKLMWKWGLPITTARAYSAIL